MRAAAAAEQQRVERELHRLNDREDSLARELEALRAARSGLEDELVVLQRLSHDSVEGEISAARATPRRLSVVSSVPQQTGRPRDVVLRGAQVRETAVRVLADTAQADQAVHYRTWFELLRQQGFVPAGKDPLATFLTQIGRSPVVQRSTSPGVYSLDLTFPQRVRGRLEQLRAQLREADELADGAGIDEITQSRERRAKLNADIENAERMLAEALRSLGE